MSHTVETTTFSWEIMEAKRKWHSIVQVLKENNRQHRVLYPTQLSCRNKGEMGILRWRAAKRICHQQTCPRRIAEGSDLIRKEMIKEGNLDYEEGRRNTLSKNVDKWNTLYYSRVFYIMLMVEAKIIHTCLVWFWMYVEKIFKMVIL